VYSRGFVVGTICTTEQNVVRIGKVHARDNKIQITCTKASSGTSTDWCSMRTSTMDTQLNGKKNKKTHGSLTCGSVTMVIKSKLPLTSCAFRCARLQPSAAELHAHFHFPRSTRNALKCCAANIQKRRVNQPR